MNPLMERFQQWRSEKAHRKLLAQLAPGMSFTRETFARAGLPQTGGECVFCGKDLAGQFHFHRKGFRKSKLCEGCYKHQGFQLHVPKMGPAMTKAKAPRASLSDADFTIPTDGRNPDQTPGLGKTMHYITEPSQEVTGATEKPQEDTDGQEGVDDVED